MIGTLVATATFVLLAAGLWAGWRAEQRGDPLPPPDPRPRCWRVVSRPPYDWERAEL